jgi:hypothetical protein
MLTLLVAALATLPQPIDLGGITPERARHLNGRIVSATFLNAAPAYTLAGRTVVGPVNREDGAERTAVLRGRRLDIEEGQRVDVVGVLRVIDHAPVVVNGIIVPAWAERRVEE